MPAVLPVSVRRPALNEALAILRLAGPMIVAQLAQTGIAFVDTVMAGRLSAADLAAVSLGSSIWLTVFLSLSGVLMALAPLVSQAFGAGRTQEIGPLVRQGLWLGLLLGGITFWLVRQAGPVLQLVGATPDVALKTQQFLAALSWGMPPVLLYRALYPFASGIGKTRPIMYITLVSLLLAIPLNYLFIYGKLGLPQLGAEGCGWAMAICCWFNFVALAIHSARNRFFRRFEVWRHWSWPDWPQQIQLLKLGLPIGVSYLVEISAFTVVALLLAQLGATVVAAHQITLNFSAIVYMVPQTVSVALTVRVGQAVGAGNESGAAYTCNIGLQLALAFACCTAIAIWFGASWLAGLYSNDPQVIALAGSLLLFAAVYQLPDAAQVCAAGALRGYKITSLPMLILVLVFWGVAIPLGYQLGLHGVPWLNAGQPLAAAGFWGALVLSLFLAAAPLLLYLRHVVRLRTRH